MNDHYVFDHLDLVNQLRILPGYRFGKLFALYAGPVLNFEVVNTQINGVAPYDWLHQSGTAVNNDYHAWIGFAIGVSLF